MEKLKFLIGQIEAVTSPELRVGRKTFLTEQGLLQNCSKTAKEKTDTKQAEMFEIGVFLTIEE